MKQNDLDKLKVEENNDLKDAEGINNSEDSKEDKESNIIVELKMQELEEKEAEILKKMKAIKERMAMISQKADKLNKLEQELDARAEDLRVEKIKLQAECDKNAERIVEEIKNRNIELNNKLHELRKVHLENELMKNELNIKDEEIKSLKTSNLQYITEINIYKQNSNIDEILLLKEKANKVYELEEENLKLKNEINQLKASNKKLLDEADENKSLNDSIEILRSRVNRRDAEINYLKRLEKSRGTGEDGSQSIFEEIINKQLQIDQNAKSEQYRNDEIFVNGFINFCEKSGFIYDKNLIRTFISSLRSSRLTILKGYSGTGKSSLPNLFAKFLKAECVVIPVQPNWRTKQDIMGFYNYFTNKFIPTELTQTLLRANVSKDRIFLVVLDEMNLARVEYYFSEFNSKIWLDESERKIELFEGITNYTGEVAKYIKNNNIDIPENVYFIGTINEDDSVSAISDKIFDRAQVIEFMELPSSKSVGNIDNEDQNIDKSKYTTLKSFKKVEENEDEYSIELIDTVNELTKESFNKVIGYRSLKQVKEFVKYFILAGGSEKDAIDRQLVSKFVPKFKSISSEADIQNLQYLIEVIGELFINKFKCTEKEVENLQIVTQLRAILNELGE